MPSPGTSLVCVFTDGKLKRVQRGTILPLRLWSKFSNLGCSTAIEGGLVEAPIGQL
jgi:hypothetical protein